MIDERYSRAVVAYIGRVGQPDAQALEDRVADAAGQPAAEIVPRIQAMLNDLNAADPPLWDTADIAEVGRRAKSWLRAHHPELSGAAITAVSNRFAFDWR